MGNDLIQFRDVIWGGRVSRAKINADPLTFKPRRRGPNTDNASGSFRAPAKRTKSAIVPRTGGTTKHPLRHDKHAVAEQNGFIDIMRDE
jgi:hypothetical protein